jgi:hypothetical protein
LSDCLSKVYTDPAIRKTDAAICSDLELVNITMNYTGNRVWPVSIVTSGSTDIILPYTGNPTSQTDVETEIWLNRQHILSRSFQAVARLAVSVQWRDSWVFGI